METELYRPQDYPREVRQAIAKLPPLAVEVANRWMRGWPTAVKAHLKSGQYLELLKDQESRERKILQNPGNSHLAHHEIMELYGLSPKPPMPAPGTTP